MRNGIWMLAFGFFFGLPATTRAVAPEVAEITFGPGNEISTNGLPVWVRAVSQTGGVIEGTPPSWIVAETAAVGVGRFEVSVDRTLIKDDVALTVLYEEAETTDLIVQLFDAQNQVIVLDLFANLMVVGPDAKTDTFIVPLVNYPTATKIVIRRIKGAVTLHGVAVYPVVTEAEADPEALKELAKLLGDPVSPDSPLSKSIRKIARSRDVEWARERDRFPERAGDPKPSSDDKSNEYKVSSRNVSAHWEVLPWPKNGNWPGPRGAPTVVSPTELVFQGQSIQSSRKFDLPLTVEAEVFLDERKASDGSIDIDFSSGDHAPDMIPNQSVGFRMIYRNPDAYSGKDVLLAYRRDGDIRGRTIWGETPFSVKAGAWYRIKLVLTVENLTMSVNGEDFGKAEFVPLTAPVRIRLSGWQPLNHWRVRNFTAF